MCGLHSFSIPIHFLSFWLKGFSLLEGVWRRRGSSGLAKAPLTEVAHQKGQSAGSNPGWVLHRGQRVSPWSSHWWVAKGSWRRQWTVITSSESLGECGICHSLKSFSSRICHWCGHESVSFGHCYWQASCHSHHIPFWKAFLSCGSTPEESSQKQTWLLCSSPHDECSPAHAQF